MSWVLELPSSVRVLVHVQLPQFSNDWICQAAILIA